MSERAPWRAFSAEWFQRHQVVLLAILNEPILGRWFRWVLRIRPEDVGHRAQILRLAPNHYVVPGPTPGSLTADFRTHPKFSKRIYFAFRPAWWVLHAWDWAVADRWVPEWSFGFATLTVYPDADPGSTSISGMTFRSGVSETWSSIRSGNGTSFNYNGQAYVGYARMSGTNATDNGRFLMTFDTSALGSTANITAAVLSVYSRGKSQINSDNPDFDIFTSTQASSTAVAASDYQTTGTTSQTGAPISYASYAASGYMDLTFNSTGRGNISKTGVSKFAGCNANYDVANVSPSSGTQWDLAISSSNIGGTSEDPKLVVTYTTDVTGTDSDKVQLSEAAFSAGTLSAAESVSAVLSETATVIGVLSATDTLKAVLSEVGTAAQTYQNPVTVEMELDGSWTDVTSDTIAPMRIRYGAWDTGPLARVSSTGTCEFSLRNSRHNSGGVVGYYSPGHANCRSGFKRGIRFRVILTYAGAPDTKFTGKISVIEPHGGLYGDQQVSCVAVDWIDELANFDARELDPQVNKRADEMLTTLVAAMPTDAQPVAQSFSVGVDTFPYAWSNLGGGRNGLGLAADVVRSDFGYLHVLGDGTAVFYDRQDESSLANTLTLSDATLRDIRAPSSFAQTYNVVRVTVHPKRVPTATIVLWQKATEDAPMVAAGETVTLWVTYRSPTNEDTLIAGQSGQFVTPVSATDYVANSAADGSGSNLTASIAITATFFATTAKLVITNSGGTDAYLTTLQVRGKGIYDLDAVTMESESTQAYGRRVLDIDMPYAEDTNVAQDIANYVRAQFDSIVNYVTEIEVRAHYSPSVLSGVLSLEPGMGVAVTESMTGITSRALRINGVELVISPPGLIVESARFAVSPRMVSDAGILDDSARGLLDSTFIVGAI